MPSLSRCVLAYPVSDVRSFLFISESNHCVQALGPKVALNVLCPAKWQAIRSFLLRLTALGGRQLQDFGCRLRQSYGLLPIEVLALGHVGYWSGTQFLRNLSWTKTRKAIENKMCLLMFAVLICLPEVAASNFRRTQQSAQFFMMGYTDLTVRLSSGEMWEVGSGCVLQFQRGAVYNSKGCCRQ